MIDIYSQSLSDLEIYFENLNENKAKAKIIYKALCNGLTDFQQLDNIKKILRDKLSQDFYFAMPLCVKKSENEKVSKFLFSLSDNNLIEAVLMRQKYGNSICISTQIGCNMGCVFCESGKQKKIRNLTCAEMVSQILYIKSILKEDVKTITIMGIGEPFDNYDEVIKFIDIVTSPYGLGVGIHHITVSTCGIIPKIYTFSDRTPTNNLAISLHAPNNELRSKLMPINKVYNIDDLVTSLKYYTQKTKRKVFVEYVMIENINDSITYATQLADLLKNLKCTVNLIPYNETNYKNYKKTSFESMMLFYRELKRNNIHATIRREFGNDVNAACGQLKSKHLE